MKLHVHKTDVVTLSRSQPWLVGLSSEDEADVEDVCCLVSATEGSLLCGRYLLATLFDIKEGFVKLGGQRHADVGS